MKTLAIALTLMMTSPAVAAARGLSLPGPDPDRGTIAVTLRLKPHLGPKISAVQVYFVRLDDGADVREARHVIRSDFSDAKQVYLLNCEPGRYVAVGAELSARGTAGEYKVFLDREAIAATEVGVEPGALAFMGEILVDSGVKINQADPAQSHFLRLLEPDMARQGFTARALSGSYLYLGSLVELDRSPDVETRFLAAAERKVFKRYPEWQSVVRDHIASLRD